jgi:hypothetical protein
MKVLVKAMAAGAIGCAGLLPATAAQAQAPGDPLPDGALQSALAKAGLGAGLFDANQVDTGVQAPVDVCGNAVGILGGATAGGGAASTGNRTASTGTGEARAPMRSHGAVERSEVGYGGSSGGGMGGSSGGVSAGGGAAGVSALPVTGAASGSLTGLGVLLIAGGAGALYAVRPRRRSRPGGAGTFDFEPSAAPVPDAVGEVAPSGARRPSPGRRRAR